MKKSTILRLISESSHGRYQFQVKFYLPLGSIEPVPSQSKRSKASLISKTYSLDIFPPSKSLGLNTAFGFDWIAVFFMKISKKQQNQTGSFDQLMNSKKRATKLEDATFKIIMVGKSAVGKSSLLTRYTKDTFQKEYMVTVGVEFASKVIKINDTFNVKMTIWDTAGQQSFKSIIKSYYRNSSAVFLVYDITNKDSFDSLEGWLKQAMQNAPQNVMYVLVGTHLDEEQNRQIPKDQAQQWVKNNQIAVYFETSAKTAQNVSVAFEEVAKQLFNERMAKAKSMHMNPNSDNLVSISGENQSKAKKTQCCSN